MQKLGPRATVPDVLLDKAQGILSGDLSTATGWLSQNKENIENYISDPLCGCGFKMALLRDLMTIANSACTSEWAYLIPPSLPILLVSGAKDPIGFNGKGVINVCDNLEDAGHHPQVILYPGDKHEILFEEDRDKIFDDILGWLTSISK